MNTPKIWDAYEPPFICDDQGATVEDSKGNVIITVRGWSHLSQLFEHDKAFQLQLDIAHFVAKRLNEYCEGMLDAFDSDLEEGLSEDSKLDNKDILTE